MDKYAEPKSDLAFDNKQTCIDATLANSKNFKSKLAFEVIGSVDELRGIVYPRVQSFYHRRAAEDASMNNMFVECPQLFKNQRLKVYANQDSDAAINTIKYVFEQFHRSIFVQIINNKIATFVVLRNENKTLDKDALRHLQIDPSKYKSKYDLLKATMGKQTEIASVEILKEKSIYFTDCVVNLWKRRGVNILRDDWQVFTTQYHMISEMLKCRNVPNAQFILNDKDQHLLVRDGVSSPHYHILGKHNYRLKNYSSSYIPILNFSSHKQFADLPIPTNDDWEIVTNQYYLGSCRSLYINILSTINTNYDSKIETAIFRGSSTGCGTLINSNQRLKLAYLSKRYSGDPKYNKDVPYLDARITKFTKTVKKHYSSKYIQRVDPDQLKLKIGKKMSVGDISKYKYVINVSGNIAAFRLTLELAYNSVILLVDSDFKLWYQPLLQPWKHYVPISADLSDLMQRIHWCKTHDDECKQIAANALRFYKQYINRESIYDYIQMTISQM